MHFTLLSLHLRLELSNYLVRLHQLLGDSLDSFFPSLYQSLLLLQLSSQSFPCLLLLSHYFLLLSGEPRLVSKLLFQQRQPCGQAADHPLLVSLTALQPSLFLPGPTKLLPQPNNLLLKTTNPSSCLSQTRLLLVPDLHQVSILHIQAGHPVLKLLHTPHVLCVKIFPLLFRLQLNFLHSSQRLFFLLRHLFSQPLTRVSSLLSIFALPLLQLAALGLQLTLATLQPLLKVPSRLPEFTFHSFFIPLHRDQTVHQIVFQLGVGCF